MEAAGCEIEDDRLLIQPCAALKGKRCSIYAHRPKCCRTFECFLLKRVRRGEISVAAALRDVDAAKRSKAAIERIFLGEQGKLASQA